MELTAIHQPNNSHELLESQQAVSSDILGVGQMERYESKSFDANADQIEKGAPHNATYIHTSNRPEGSYRILPKTLYFTRYYWLRCRIQQSNVPHKASPIYVR